jgi:ankyrin repeat protein
MKAHTPLADAAVLSDPTALRTLLSYGATDPDAMFHAIGLRRQHNGTATMEALIENGADVNYVSRRWSTPLHRAIRVYDEEKLMLLLDHGADPSVRSLGGRWSALEVAMDLGRADLVDVMEAAQGQRAP